jgi:NADH:ubiquinone oxidoreductase subunit K
MVNLSSVPLSWYLLLGAAIFCIGVYGVLSSRNLILTMMSLEIMLNAVAFNFVTFARFMEPSRITGKTFAIIIYALAASEAALGLALIISIWRTENTVEVEKMDLLQG